MRTMLMGLRPVYAPNTDEGSEAFDDADADDLETGAGADDADEPDEPDADEPSDDEPDADEAGDELEPEPAPAARGRGASDTIRELRSRAQEAERRAQELEARVAERERSQSAELARQREEERLALMSPEERLEHRVNQRLAQIEINTWSTQDRVAFDGLANSNPAVASLRDEVEATFQQRLAAGQPVDRKTIAAFLIGQKALAAAPRAARKGAKAAEAGRAKNATRATSGRGDVPRSETRSQNEAEARRRRLENTPI